MLRQEVITFVFAAALALLGARRVEGQQFYGYPYRFPLHPQYPQYQQHPQYPQFPQYPAAPAQWPNYQQPLVQSPQGYYPYPGMQPALTPKPPMNRESGYKKMPIIYFRKGDIVDYEYTYDTLPEVGDNNIVIIKVDKNTPSDSTFISNSRPKEQVSTSTDIKLIQVPLPKSTKSWLSIFKSPTLPPTTKTTKAPTTTSTTIAPENELDDIEQDKSSEKHADAAPVFHGPDWEKETSDGLDMPTDTDEDYDEDIDEDINEESEAAEELAELTTSTTTKKPFSFFG